MFSCPVLAEYYIRSGISRGRCTFRARTPTLGAEQPALAGLRTHFLYQGNPGLISILASGWLAWQLRKTDARSLILPVKTSGEVDHPPGFVDPE
jgi:hypothetical protein